MRTPSGHSQAGRQGGTRRVCTPAIGWRPIDGRAIVFPPRVSLLSLHTHSLSPCDSSRTPSARTRTTSPGATRAPRPAQTASCCLCRRPASWPGRGLPGEGGGSRKGAAIAWRGVRGPPSVREGGSSNQKKQTMACEATSDTVTRHRLPKKKIQADRHPQHSCVGVCGAVGAVVGGSGRVRRGAGVYCFEALARLYAHLFLRPSLTSLPCRFVALPCGPRAEHSAPPRHLGESKRGGGGCVWRGGQVRRACRRFVSAARQKGNEQSTGWIPTFLPSRSV